jgi:dGTPase
LDGLVKHNGPLLPLPAGKHLPVTIDAFRHEFDLELSTFAGIEAQIAAISDDIAYNTHDIEDGIRAQFFTLDDLLDLPLVGEIIREVTGRYPGLETGRAIHETTRRLIDRLVRDLVGETERRLAQLAPQSADSIRQAGHPVVALSEEVARAEKALRGFLDTRFYHDYRVNRMTSKARHIVADLFRQFSTEPETLPTEWQAEVATDGASMHRVIADYIAGMTDRFAIAEHRRFFDFHDPQ